MRRRVLAFLSRSLSGHISYLRSSASRRIHRMPKKIQLQPKFPRQSPPRIKRNMRIPVSHIRQPQPVIMNITHVPPRLGRKIILRIFPIPTKRRAINMIRNPDHIKRKIMQRIPKEPVNSPHPRMRFIHPRRLAGRHPPKRINLLIPMRRFHSGNFSSGRRRCTV